MTAKASQKASASSRLTLELGAMTDERSPNAANVAARSAVDREEAQNLAGEGGRQPLGAKDDDDDQARQDPGARRWP